MLLPVAVERGVEGEIAGLYSKDGLLYPVHQLLRRAPQGDGLGGPNPRGEACAARPTGCFHFRMHVKEGVEAIENSMYDPAGRPRLLGHRCRPNLVISIDHPHPPIRQQGQGMTERNEHWSMAIPFE